MIGRSRAEVGPPRVKETNSDGDPADVARLRGERDLYLKLLDLGLQEALEPFLEEALGLVTRVVGAHQGYLELGASAAGDESARWWVAHGFSSDEVNNVRLMIS